MRRAAPPRAPAREPSSASASSASTGFEALPDSVESQFLFRWAPPRFHPFLQLARLDRPIGWWLLLLPCWWSSALASISQRAPLHWRDLALFFAGAVVMRGAGSTYNDIADRKIDAKVARTKGRPLASGRVGVKGALFFLAAQCLGGLAVLLNFNAVTIAMGFASLGAVALYPFMKRVTSFPQAVLGMAFAWGALVGWPAVTGSLALAPVLLYLGAVFWTIGYDTIYAVQDIEDDALAGIGSSALFFGPHLRRGVAGLYAASAIFMEAALASAHTGLLAQAGLFLFALHLAWQALRLDPADGVMALRLFRSNRNAGLLLFGGLAADVLSGTAL
jgi:4-hydroxybenzoate polyprenyltransferase